MAQKGYLLDPFEQIEDNNGLPVVSGKVYVYDHNTTNLSTIYSDFDNHLQTNPAILDTLGNTTIIANGEDYFDIEVHDANDTLLFSKKKIQCAQAISEEIITNPNIIVTGTNYINVTAHTEDDTKTYTVSADTNNLATTGWIFDHISDGTGIRIIREDSPFHYITCQVAGSGCLDNFESYEPESVHLSVAHGADSVAFARFSHAEGSNTSAISMFSHAEGLNTIAGELNEDGDCESVIGMGSHSEGGSCSAFGNFSHAEGGSTVSYENCSHAEGDETLVSGVGAHAEGYQTTAINVFAHSEGQKTVASGVASHTEGSGTTAIMAGAHAEGDNTLASGQYAHSEGNQCSAISNYSHAEGWNTYANSYGGHTEGVDTSAFGWSNHAEGEHTLVSGNDSHAEGFDTSAIQNAAHSEGYQTLASGQYSHAEGMNTTTRDYGAHSQGIYTSAIGMGSFAGGHNSIASANYSVALGENVIANGESQTVFGKYNTSSTDDLFQIGNGSALDARNNALTVDVSGSTNVNTSAGLKNTRTFFDNLGDVNYVYTRQQPIYACTGSDFIKDEHESTSSVYAIMASDLAIPNAKKVKVDGYIQIKGGIRPDKTVGYFALDPVIETWLSAGDSAYEINAGVISNGGSLPRSVPIPFSFVTGGVDSFKFGFCSENTFQFWNGSGAYVREAGNLFINYTTTILDKE